MFVYSIRQLINYNVHIGHYKWVSDFRISYFFLGLRNFIYIINLYFTLYTLKSVIYNLYNLGLINQRILIVNNVNYPISSMYNDIEKNRLWYVSKKWIGGLLTNQRDLYVYNEKLFSKFYDVGFSSLLPSFIFVSNIEMTSSCIYEAIILKISNSSLFDTNLGLYGIFYKLCSNDDNFAIMMLFSRILLKTYLKSIYDKTKLLIKKKFKKKAKLYIKKVLKKFEKTFEKTYKKKKKFKIRMLTNIKKIKKKLNMWLSYFYFTAKKKSWKPIIDLPEEPIAESSSWWIKDERIYLKKEDNLQFFSNNNQQNDDNNNKYNNNNNSKNYNINHNNYKNKNHFKNNKKFRKRNKKFNNYNKYF